MKKYFLFAFCALLLVVVTGCGSKNVVKCSGKMEGQEAEITAEFDSNDKLTTATVVEDAGSKEAADQICSMYNAFASQMPEGVSVSCSGSKVTIKGFEKMADSEEDDAEKMVGLSKEDFKKAMEEQTEGQVTCK